MHEMQSYPVVEMCVYVCMYVRIYKCVYEQDSYHDEKQSGSGGKLHYGGPHVVRVAAEGLDLTHIHTDQVIQLPHTLFGCRQVHCKRFLVYGSYQRPFHSHSDMSSSHYEDIQIENSSI